MPAQAAAGEENPLDQIETLVDIATTTLTGIAVIIGGVWAYFKFIKGRTFRPRIETGLAGQWHLIGERPVLQAHLTIKNIGASKVVLVQDGTALIVKRPSGRNSSPPAALSWDDGEVFEVFVNHAWIEPGEVVSDDLLLDLGEQAPVPTLFDVRTIWKRTLFKNIDVTFRKFIDTDSTLNGKNRIARPSHDLQDEEAWQDGGTAE